MYECAKSCLTESKQDNCLTDNIDIKYSFRGKKCLIHIDLVELSLSSVRIYQVFSVLNKMPTPSLLAPFKKMIKHQYSLSDNKWLIFLPIIDDFCNNFGGGKS